MTDLVGELEDNYPTVIVSLSEFCCFIRTTETDSKKLVIFESGDLSFAIAITDMLEHIRLHLGHAPTGTMSRLVTDIDGIEGRSINI